MRPERGFKIQGILIVMGKIIRFLKEVRHELSKVSWPTNRQIVQYTIVVIAISLAMAAFLGLLDFIFEYLLNIFILK